MQIWEWVNARARSVIWMFILVALIGMLQFYSLPVSFLPPIPSRNLILIFQPENVKASGMEADARQIISHFRGFPDIADITYVLSPGKLKVTLSFEDYIDVGQLIPEIRARLDGLRNTFQHVYPSPIIYGDGEADHHTFKMMVHGDMPIDQISQWVSGTLLPRIRQLEGISFVDVSGLVNRRLTVLIRSDREKHWLKRRFGSDISAPGPGVSLRIAAGNQTYPLILDEDTPGLSGWLGYSAASSEGKSISLSELGFMGYEYLDDQGVHYYAGKRAVAVKVFTRSDKHLHRIHTDLFRLREELEKQQPDVQLSMVENHSLTIRQGLSGLWYSLFLALAGVLVALYAFIKDIRLPLLIGLMIPLSFLMAAGLMRMTGMSLNIISLSGLILATGLLVDNGIVMVEGMIRNHREGVSAVRACHLGIREMLPPLAGSNLTTLVILVPLLTGGGLLAYIFGEEARTMMAAIMCSLLIALILLPVLYVRIFRRKAPRGETRYYGYVKRQFFRMSSISYRFPVLIIGLHAFVVLISVCLGSHLPVRFSPGYNRQHWLVDHLESGTDRPSDVPLAAGNVEYMVTAGYLMEPETVPRYNVYGRNAPDVARQLARLNSGTFRPGEDPMSALFNASAPDVEVIFAGEVTNLKKFLQGIRKTGDDIRPGKTGRYLSQERREILGPVESSGTENTGKLHVQYSSADSIILRQGKRAVYASNVLQDYIHAGKGVVSGNLIGQTASISYSSEEFETSGKLHLAAARSQGVSAQVGGGKRQGESLGRDLVQMALVSFGLLYFVLLIQYGSVLWPIPVLAVLPAGLAGSLLLLYVTGQSLNIMSGIGLIAMLGIIVNDAILKVSAIKKYWGTGSPEDVFRRSLDIRLRPILMTTGTTLISCVPILMMPGAGNEIQRSLAIALIGGVFSATLAAVFLIPAMIKWAEVAKVSLFGIRQAAHRHR